MGKIKLSCLKLWHLRKNPHLPYVIQKQLNRKIASGARVFRYRLICFIYQFLLLKIEQYRFIHYVNLFQKLCPKRIALWNGQKLPNETAVLAAKYLSIPIVFFENGLLPNTTTIDHKGVNTHNSLPREKHFYHSFSFSNIDLPEPQLVVRQNHRNKKVTREIKLPERYLFVPLQVPNDTQVIANSSWIKDMDHFLEEVIGASSALPQDLKLVVKEHPSWPGDFKEAYKNNSRVIFANGNPTQQLIEHAEAIITINSTVGIESLLLNKKVITVGQACYNIDELSLHAPDSETLRHHLLSLDSWQPNKYLQIQFLAFLKSYYCITGSYTKANNTHFKAAEQRLLQLDKFSQLIAYLDSNSNEFKVDKVG